LWRAENPSKLGAVTAPPKTEPAPDYEVEVLGAPRPPLRDFYHALMRLSWTRTLLLVGACYFALNALFALGYLATGGLAHARPQSFRDAFYFSVQTMGTIGYGSIYPESDASNALVVLQSTLSLVFTALVTGLVFAKFSRPTARLLFSHHATIAPMNGKPTLSFRLGNLRANRIVEAQVRVAMVRTEHTTEGKVFYRMLDLQLTRERILSLSRSWTVLHVIDESSPLYGSSPASLADDEVEFLVTVTGTDDTWMQQVHSSHRYRDSDVLWGSRHVDILTDTPTRVTLDLRRFHDVEPAQPSQDFPYPSLEPPPAKRMLS
jgi:inward rectifier potassium channel